MNTFLFRALTASLLVLSACGASSDSASNSTTDTPQTRLKAVENIPAFNQFIQTPKCDPQTKSVRSVTYKAFYTYNVTATENFPGFTCEARTRFIIDSRTSLFKLVEECLYSHSVRTLSTSHYKIVDNTLVVDGFGTIEAQSSGVLVFLPPTSDTIRSGISRLDESELTTGDDHSAYHLFCGY